MDSTEVIEVSPNLRTSTIAGWENAVAKIRLDRDPVVAAAAVLAMVLLRTTHQRHGQLELGEYFGSTFVDGLLTWPHSLIVVLQLPTALILLRTRWTDVELGRELRLLSIAGASALAIGFFPYAYNDFLGRWHPLERLLVLGLAVGVYFRPAFIPVFTAVCYVVATQFNIPMGGYTLTDKLVVFEVLWVVQAGLAWLVLVRPPRPSARPVLLASLMAIAAWYVAAGFEKLGLDWHEHSRLGNLVIASHLDGWLRFVPLGWFEQIGELLNSVSLLWVPFVLVAEIGAIGLVGRHRVRQPLLVMILLMHTGVFATTGIFFWKWMIIEGALLIGLHKKELYTGHRAVAASFVGVLALQTLAPVRLGWIDSNVVHVFEMELATKDGQSYPVPERYFAPFDVIITQDRFGYLADGPVVAGTFGAAYAAVDIDRLMGADIDEIEQVIADEGIVQTSRGRAQIFDLFVQRLCPSWIGQRWTTPAWPLIPPPHIWTSDPDSTRTIRGSPSELRVTMSTWFVDGTSTELVSSELVHTVDLESCTS